MAFDGCIHRVKLKDVSARKLQDKSIHSSFKILHVFECPSLKTALDTLTQEIILQALEKCSHLLILIISGQLQDTIGEQYDSRIINLISRLRPLVVQVISEVYNVSTIFDGESSVKLSGESLLRHIGYLQIFLRESIIKRYETLNLEVIAEKGSSFDVRFTKLVAETTSIDKFYDELEASIRSKKLENFKAVLDFSFENRTICLSTRKQERLLKTETKDFLRLAIENNNVEVVEFISQFKDNLEPYVELCWARRQEDCLAALIEADAPFPKSFFAVDEHLLSKRLQGVLEQRNYLHEKVREGKIAEVKKVIETFPKLEYAYNRNNKSLLTTALSSGHFNLYAMLLSKGFSIGIDDTFKYYIENLNKEDKALIRDINQKCFKADDANSHIIELLKKSRLGMHNSRSRAEHFREIRKMYESLNAIPEITPILKLVAFSKNILIVFDFNHDSTVHIDPTKDKDVKGSLYIRDEIIYVGAKFEPSEYFEGLATLAHELTHYAMQLTYKNLCRPYKEQESDEFNTIDEKSRNIFFMNEKDQVPTMKDAFLNYDSSLAHAELIVRVPHVLALYQSEPATIFKLQKTFSDLFDYFENKVLVDVEKRIRKLFDDKQLRIKIGEASENKQKLVTEVCSHLKAGDDDKKQENSEVQKCNQPIFKRIDEKSIFEIEFYLLQTTAISSAFWQNKKILYVRNCPNIHKVAGILTDFEHFLHHSSIFFVVAQTNNITELDETLEFGELLLEKLRGIIKKPMIVQLLNDSTNLVLYKEDEKWRKLKASNSLKTFDGNSLNFQMIYDYVSQKCSEISPLGLNLLETQIDLNESFSGFRLIDWAVKSNNLMCLQFLQLFKPDLESYNDNFSRVLEVAAEHGSLETFHILLDILQDTLKLGSSFKTILNMVSKKNETLLMIATRNRKLDIVRFLIQSGLDVNHRNNLEETASDLAWKDKNFNILLELLYNDAPFPKDFNEHFADSEVQALRIKVLISNRYQFHEAIENGDMEKIQFNVESSKLKFAYDTKNCCALSKALLSNQFEVYSFLKSKGFSSGIDPNVEKYLRELNYDQRYQLRRSNLKYFHFNNNRHVLDLLSKSRLAFGSVQQSFSKIQMFYEKLDTIPEISTVLKIIANVEKVDIVFDFSSDFIKSMDPTAAFKDRSKGRTYYKSGNVLICSKSKAENIVWAVLARELTRYALQLVYENNCLPFHAEDEERRKEFEVIADTCNFALTKSEKAKVHKKSSIEHKMCELAVKVPYFMALYVDDFEKLEDTRQRFAYLFEFFTQQILPDLHSEEALMKQRKKVCDLNKSFGLLDKIRTSNAPSLIRKIKLEKSFEISNICIISKHPKIILKNFIEELENTENFDGENIFITAEKLLEGRNFHNILETTNGQFKPRIFVFHSGSCNLDNVFELFKEQMSFILISKETCGILQDVVLITENIKWNDLTEHSKDVILNEKVTFQDSVVLLFDLISNSNILKDMQLEEVLQPKLENTKLSLPTPAPFYIERTFLTKENQKLNSNKIINLLEKERIVIIADSAGMGKTTAAVNIARKIKSGISLHYVVFLELKQHTNVFEKFHHQEEKRIDLQFCIKDLLGLQSNLERKVFENFFETGKVVFIIDGFNEICPNYKTVVLKFLNFVRKSSNQLLVTTRPYLAKLLEDKLRNEALKIVPFTKDDQITFLTNILQNKCHEKNVESVQELMDKLSEEFFGTPLYLRMLADVIENEENVHQKFIIYSLYKHFTLKKIEIWAEKVPLACKDSILIQCIPFNIVQVHQKVALGQILKQEKTEKLQMLEFSRFVSDEQIARIGLLAFSAKERFTFFDADFILDNIMKKTELRTSDSIEKLFMEISIKDDSKMIRNFINERLQTVEIGYGNEMLLSDKLDKLLSVSSSLLQSFLKKLIREEHFNLAFNLLKLDEKTELKFLKDRITWKADNFKLPSLAARSFEFFNVYWKFIEHFMDKNELRKFLINQVVKNKDYSEIILKSISDEITKLSKLTDTKLEAFNDIINTDLVKNEIIFLKENENTESSEVSNLFSEVKDLDPPQTTNIELMEVDRF